MRSPHKTKAGVSGCVRDCAEAKIKDFGLVATDKGWNLIVAGNGGRDAATGKVLAQDVDEDTIVKYLDRLLMYYIRTADHLARSVTWLDGIEGGIDRLRDVIVNDTLGIADSLEQDMKRIIEGQSCEWARAVADQDILSRFRHYINAPGSDPTVVHIPLRGQMRAATPEERRQLRPHKKVAMSLKWADVADESCLIPNMGVNALVDGEDVAIFRLRNGAL